MDKLSFISGALFLAADIFAIASLAMPNWLESEVGGNTHVGLLHTCITIYERDMTCFTPSHIRGEWLLTILCIVVGIFCISITITLLIISYWKYEVKKNARWLGFVAMLMFCTAAVIFPMAFNMEQIGGEPYQLPSSHRVGISYIFFVLALWITVISELFVSKICLPHF